MSQQVINTGAFANDPIAENINSAFTKVNAMTSELYSTFSLSGRIPIDLGSTPDTIRAAFQAINTMNAQLYTARGVSGYQTINIGAFLDDPSAFTIQQAFDRVNTQMTALYGTLNATPLAFPGALGFGAATRHAYAGSATPVILRVTNVNDSGAGSLRAALLDPRPRIVIFETSGVCSLASMIRIVDPYIFVAGATAPAPGFNVRNYGIQVETNDVVLQHLRNRVGIDGSVASGVTQDGFAAYTNSRNVMFDHLSVAWSIDGSIDVSSGPLNGRNITVSNCLVMEPIRNSSVPGAQQGHSRPFAVQYDSWNISHIRNMTAHTQERLPFMKSNTRTVVINNLFYDCYNAFGTYWSDPELRNGAAFASIVGNRYVQGLSAGLLAIPALTAIRVRDSMNTGTRIYMLDNAAIGAAYTLFRNDMAIDPVVTSPPSQAPITGIPVLAQSNVAAHVLANVGARPLNRDSVDARAITEFNNGTGQYKDAPGTFPTLSVTTRLLTTPSNPHTVASSGYTNLEEWLHTYAAGVEP